MFISVPELGLWWETHNTVYGRTRNPWDTRRTAGGSTGGEVNIKISQTFSLIRFSQKGALLGAGATLLSLGFRVIKLITNLKRILHRH